MHVYTEQNRDEWCHLCGRRSTGTFLQIFCADNAEGERRDNPTMRGWERPWRKKGYRYFRLCASCVQHCGAIFQEGERTASAEITASARTI